MEITAEDSALAAAWTLPVARRIRPGFEYQKTGTTCGPSSLANVWRSYDGRNIDERDVLATCNPRGLTLDDLAAVAANHPGHRATVLRDLTFEQFRAELRHANDPRRRTIINFHRQPLFGAGGGHHSPIGGYLEREDLVFVLDTNDRYRPFLVDAARLFQAMNTIDTATSRKRGLLRIDR